MGQCATLVHVRPYSDVWYSLVWSGFILSADALLERRTGASLVSARRRDLVLMSVSSAAIWWLFELANAVHLASWSYTPSPDVPRWAQEIRSTVAFATLLPASWLAGALALSHLPIDPSPRRATPSRWPVAALSIGVALGAAAVHFQALSLPLGLAGALLVLDATNAWRGRTTLLGALGGGRWRMPAALFGGNVAAGVVGEMWNYPADPKWTYDAPYVGDVRLFEMPLPGYLGYGLLAWVLFAAYHALRARPRHEERRVLGADHPLIRMGLD